MSNESNTNRLIETLQELALSNIKEDNKAIARIESKYGQSIAAIIEEIENNAIIQQSIRENVPKVSKPFLVLRQLSVGFFVSSMVGESKFVHKA